jgi:hypothetical protein
MREKCIIPGAGGFSMKSLASVLLVVVVASFVAPAAASAQAIAARVDGAAAHRYVATLASPEFQGRRLFTPGFDKAADWASARFGEWKLQPAGDSGTFFQEVRVAGPDAEFVWATGMPALAIGGRAFSFKEGDFVVDNASTPATDVTAEAVFAGYGISAPDRGLDEYAGLDVAGKVVFVLRGSPKDAPPDLSDFPPDPPKTSGPPEAWTEESTDRAKVMTAYRKGAAAIVLCEADPEARRARRWTALDRQASPFARPFVVVAAMDPRVLRALALRDEGETLVGYVDRINRMRRAIQQKTARSESTGVRVRVKGYDEVVRYGESLGNARSRNVLAKIEGNDPALGRQAVVIGAHLDHLGYRSGLLHPGADDDASGSAVVLEIARTLSAAGFRPRRTIVFALWCGEEEGHYGSKRFASAPPDGLSPDRIVAYINMDMVGLGSNIDAMGARDFPAVFSVMMRDQLPEVARLVVPDVTGPGGSDYASFIAQGIDSVALFTGGGNGHPDYHDAADVAAKVQPELLASVGQFVMQAAASLADETATPLPVAGRRETCDALGFVVPDLAGQAEDGWHSLAARTPEEVEIAALAAARRAGRKEESGAGGDSGESAPPILAGVRSKAVSGNPVLLSTAAVALGVGRIDVEGDDPDWRARGGLTAGARTAIRAAEQGGVVVHLTRPAMALLDEVLSAGSRPVLVSGTSDPDAGMARRVAARGGVFALACAPDRVQACAANLDALRRALGESAGLLVTMPAGAEGSRDASHALYRELARKGWSKPEIYAVAGLAPDGEIGGNLARLTGKRAEKCEVRSPKCEVRSAKCEVRSAKCEVRSTKCEVRSAK